MRPVPALVLALALALAPALAPPAPAAAAEATVANASRPTRCAEEDNVYVRLSAPAGGGGIAGFRVLAEHPPYAAGLERDLTAPDFTACDMSGDPAHAFAPRSLTLHEDDRLALVGHAYPSFWRAESVPLTVAGRTEAGLHLIQLFHKEGGRRIEYAVLYPPDGYWRLKPLPPANLPDSAYGSSFLVGPVEEDGRPLVRIAAIEFVPGERLFRLDFARGGSATVRVAALDGTRAELAVALDPPVAAGLPFAALRSMYVTEGNADVAEASWREGAEAPWRTLPVLAPLETRAEAVRFGRSVPSRHNASAPDLSFDRFRDPARDPKAAPP